MKKVLIIALTFIFSSCAIQMGKIPIIVKKLDQDEINYDELMKIKSEAKSTKEITKDCLQVYVLVPTKLHLDIGTVLKKSCNKSNFSFDNKIYDEVFYFIYGQECFVNESYCENT